jgi:hypothetical protein
MFSIEWLKMDTKRQYEQATAKTGGLFGRTFPTQRRLITVQPPIRLDVEDPGNQKERYLVFPFSTYLTILIASRHNLTANQKAKKGAMIHFKEDITNNTSPVVSGARRITRSISRREPGQPAGGNENEPGPLANLNEFTTPPVVPLRRKD